MKISKILTNNRSVGDSKLLLALSSILAALMVVITLSLAGCSGEPLTTREKGTLIGGAAGAGGGALVGAAVGHPAAGAAIGGVTGAGAGYLIGNHEQNEEDRNYYRQNNGY